MTPLSVPMAQKDESQSLLFLLHPSWHLRCTREAQTTPAFALASAEEEGSLVQCGVVTTSFWKHQKGFSSS